jgi:hypothetical protein
LIFIKTYKTASTTIAMILNSVANDLNLQALHPLDTGWYQENELKSRADAGQSYDLSYRHLSPVVEYDQLARVVPEALLTTGTPPPPPSPSSPPPPPHPTPPPAVMRNPDTKFVSMFNFVQTTKSQFGTPERFVNDGVFGGQATDQQVNDLCNNMAYTLSGKQDVLGRLTEAESIECAPLPLPPLPAPLTLVTQGTPTR